MEQLRESSAVLCHCKATCGGDATHRFPHTLVHEASDVSTGDWVVLDMPVESASAMLRVPFAVYEHRKTGNDALHLSRAFEWISAPVCNGVNDVQIS